MNLAQPGLWFLYKPCSNNFGLNIWAPISIQRYKNNSGYKDTTLYGNKSRNLKQKPHKKDEESNSRIFPKMSY